MSGFKKRPSHFSDRRRKERSEERRVAEAQREQAARELEPVKPSQAPSYLSQMDEDFESSLVGPNEPGVLVPVSEGRRGAGSRISVHGINDSPDSMAGITEGAVDTGAKTSTFAYDDQHRRLGRSSDDLARALVAEMAANPDGPMVIDAHSMGTRVTLDAVRKLVESGELGDRALDLNLIAPPLAGITGGGAEIGTNASRLDPTLGLLGAMVPGVRPGKDMGSGSPFQKQLEAMELPENVRTRLFTGGRDEVVDATDHRFRAMADKLAAPEDQHHFPEADHMSVLDDARKELFGR